MNRCFLLLLLPAAQAVAMSGSPDDSASATFDDDEVISCTIAPGDTADKSNFCSLHGRYLLELVNSSGSVTEFETLAGVKAGLASGFSLPTIKLLTSVINFNNATGASSLFDDYPVIDNWYASVAADGADTPLKYLVSATEYSDSGSDYVMAVNMVNHVVTRLDTTLTSQAFYTLGVSEFFQIVSMADDKTLCIAYSESGASAAELATCDSAEINQRWTFDSANHLVNQYSKNKHGSNVYRYCLNGADIEECDPGEVWSAEEGDGGSNMINVRLKTGTTYLRKTSGSALELSSAADDSSQRWTLQY